MTITQLQPISNDRFLIGLDDGNELCVPLSVVTDLSLCKGLELTEEALRSLRDAVALANAKTRAMRMISARPLSEKELADRLVEKGETQENAAACVQWLREKHFLDDCMYAGMVARHYAAKGYGPGRVKNEFYRRGIPKKYWDDALSELGDSKETVDRLLRARLRGAEPDRTALKRAADYLFRRGYAWEEIRAAIERLQSEDF